MDSVIDRTLTQLGISFDRKVAMAEAVATGHVGQLPWARETPTTDLDLPVGTLLEGRYEVLSEIGRGSFGAVFRAMDRATEQQVAVKVLTRPAPSLVERMEREIDVLRRLDLPGVVGFLDEGEWDQHPLVVMQLVAGEAFPGSDTVRSWACLGPRVVALCEAVARVHGAGVLHRDIKPDNVLWLDDHPTLLDFGLAIDGQLVLHNDELAGSPAYLAPEQYVGDAPTVRSDLFALGVVIYECLAGHRPFPGERLFEVVRHMLGSDPPPLHTVADVPEPVSRVVHQLLARSPDDRPGSAVEVVRALLPHIPRLALSRLGHEPMSRAGLQGLFAGPELLHHLRSLPAEQLWERTGGWPSAVRRTVSAWGRAGMCALDDDGRIALGHAEVARLRAGLIVDPCRSADGLPLTLNDDHLLTWHAVFLLGHHATLERVAAATHIEACLAQHQLDVLGEAGVLVATATRWAARRIPPRPTPAQLVDAVLEQLPADADDRLTLLLADRRLEQVPATALAVATAREAEGAFQRAWTAASEGLRVERRMGADDDTLLVAAACIALKGSDAGWMSTVALEAHRRGSTDVAWLCDAGGVIVRRMASPALLGERTLQHPELELWRLRLLAYVMQRAPLPQHEAWVDGIAARAEELEPSGASYRAWRARLLLRKGRATEAAALAAEGLDDEADPHRWVATALNTIAIWLEAGAFAEAETLSAQVEHRIASLGVPSMEGHHQGVLHSLRYRRGVDIEEPVELVEALRKLDTPNTTASVMLMLGAAAWRRGDDERARELAGEAGDCWHTSGRGLYWSMAWTLQCLAGYRPSSEELARAATAVAPEGPPALRAQVIAGSTLAGHPVGREHWPQVRTHLLAMDYPHDARREILSIREITDALEGGR